MSNRGTSAERTGVGNTLGRSAVRTGMQRLTLGTSRAFPAALNVLTHTPSYELRTRGRQVSAPAPLAIVRYGHIQPEKHAIKAAPAKPTAFRRPRATESQQTRPGDHAVRPSPTHVKTGDSRTVPDRWARYPSDIAKFFTGHAATRCMNRTRATSPAGPNRKDATMNESTFPTEGSDYDPMARDVTGRQPRAGAGQPGGRPPSETASPPPPVALETNARDPNRRFVGRILPWIIAAVGVLLAAIAIGVLAANGSSEPRPVARLAAESDSAPGDIPIDEEVATEWEVTDADFVSYGSYGSAEIWSTTTPAAKRCLGVVVAGDTWMFSCTAPTFETIVDIDINPRLVPPSPSGELASNVRFVLHDEVVDVFLAPNPDGGFY